MNTINEAPAACHISSPRDKAEVSSTTPILQVTNTTDPDGDLPITVFQVFSSDMSTVVAQSPDLFQGEAGTTSWEMNPRLSENTLYLWQVVSTDGHGVFAASPVVSFYVNTANDAPPAPVITSPEASAEVTEKEVRIVIINSLDPEGNPVSHLFECDIVSTFDSPWKIVSGTVPEGLDTTAWDVSALCDNTEYFFREKATDGAAESPWVQGSFFVNTANDRPLPPTLRNPGDGAWVAALKPTLEVNAASDPDHDLLTYRFQVYEDSSLADLVSQGESDVPAWFVPTPLTDHERYAWRARAEDEHGEASEWTQVSWFLVDNNGVDDPPEVTLLEPAVAIKGDVQNVLIRWVDADPENEAYVDL
ncbi:MAG: hypothetical protein GX443_06040 [Deltaproteobacteria bacterium]|nr:hypothetical protein [Deltaproteobacteria bacterium]